MLCAWTSWVPFSVFFALVPSYICPFVKTLTDSEQIKGGLDDTIFIKSPIGPISFNNEKLDQQVLDYFQ